MRAAGGSGVRLRSLSSRDDGLRKVATGLLLLHPGEPAATDDAAAFVARRRSEFHQLVPDRLLGWYQNVWLSLGGDDYLASRLERVGRRRSQSLAEVHRAQGAAILACMGTITPEFRPLKAYVGHSLVPGSLERAVQEIHEDAPRRVVVLPLLPHFWCGDSGAALNALVAVLRRLSSPAAGGAYGFSPAQIDAYAQPEQKAAALGPRDLADFKPVAEAAEHPPDTLRQLHTHSSSYHLSPPIRWSLIDRWPAHPAVADGWAKLIQEDLAKRFPPDVRHTTAILFCAPNLRWFGAKSFKEEIAASALRVVENLSQPYAYRIGFYNSWLQSRLRLNWSSSVRYQLVDLVWQGYKNILLVPLALTTDCVDSVATLPDLLDEGMLKRLGAHTVKLLPPPGESSAFVQGVGELVKNHCLRGLPPPAALGLRCEVCISPACLHTRQLFLPPSTHAAEAPV